jgi:LacI family transcriptional regulator
LRLAGGKPLPFNAVMPERLPTMNDIARASGFARATVSLALRNDSSLPLKTRKRILAVARRLGYRPNPLVSALMIMLRTKRPIERHTVLALVTSHPPADDWRKQRTFAEMAAGAQKRAVALGYRLEEFSLRAEGMTPQRYVAMLAARNIHGLIVNPLPHHQRELEIALGDFAVVGLGASVASPPIERVSNDHFQSVVLAMQECRKLGYERIGLAVSREMSERLENRWLSGFHLAEQRVPPSRRVPPLMPAQTAEVEQLLPGWYRKEKPDVVLFGYFSPRYQACLPARVGIVALSVYDLNGPLTGIFQNSRAIGAVAVDHVVGRLQRNQFGPDTAARLHLMSGAWARGRTAPGRGLDRAIVGDPKAAYY